MAFVFVFSFLILNSSFLIGGGFAAAAALYYPGETLEPNCLPSNSDCTVTAPAISGANNDITSLSALVNASTTNLTASGETTLATANVLVLNVTGHTVLAAASTTEVTVGNKLTVSGNTSLQNASTTNLSASGWLNIGGNITAGTLTTAGITLGGEYRATWPSGGGASGYWATSTDSLVGYPSLSGTYAIVIGGSATTSAGLKFEVIGNTKLGGTLNVTGNTTLVNASTTEVTVANKLTAGGLTISGSTLLSALTVTGLADLSTIGSSTGVTTILGRTILTNASTTNLTVSTTATLGSLASTYLAVNATGQIVATTTPISGVVWGAITGTLSTQTDLQTALDNRLLISTTSMASLATLSGLSTIGSSTGTTTVAGKLNLSAGSVLYYNNAILAQASTTQNNYFFGGAGNLTSLGGNNLAAGYQSLITNTYGNNNVALGYQALIGNTNGISNTAVGAVALSQLSNGANYNTALGYNAGGANISGSSNVFLGFNAGHFETGSNSFYVDNQSRTNTAGDKSGALLYGVFNATPASQTLTINASTTISQNLSVLGTGSSYFAGLVGIGTTSPSNALEVNGSGYFTGNLWGASFTATNTLSVLGTGNSYVMGHFGVGSSSPLAWLTVHATNDDGSDLFTIATTSAGTTTIALMVNKYGDLQVGNGLSYDAEAGQTNIFGLNTGSLAFEPDAGAVSWTDMGVTATSSAGTILSYTAQLGGVAAITVYGEANGGTELQYGPLVSIGATTTTPTAMLTVFGTSSAAVFHLVSSASSSLLLVTDSGKVGIGSSTPLSTLSVQGTTGTNPFTIASSTGNGMFVINQAGFVGIGSTTPGVALSVTGDTYISGALTLGSLTLGTALSPLFGGTGLAGAYTIGDLIYASDVSTLARLHDAALGYVLVSGGVGVAPSWDKISVSQMYGTFVATSSLLYYDGANINSTTSPVIDSFTTTSTTSTSTIAGSVDIAGGSLTTDYETGITSIGALETGSLSFDSDAGAVSWIDMPITASSSAGTILSYTAQLGGVAALTVYGEADGGTGLSTGPLVAIGATSTTPTAMLTVFGTTSAAVLHLVSSASSSLLLVTDSGNVGIGSSTPLSTLSVSGTAGTNPFTVASSTGQAMLTVLQNGNLTMSNGNISLPTSGTGIIGQGNSSLTFTTNGVVNLTALDNSALLSLISQGTNGRIGFKTGSASGGTLRMIISASGDIAIGTTTPWSKLSIQGNYGSTTNLFEIASTTSSAFATSSMFVVLANGNIGIGSSTPTALLTVHSQLGGLAPLFTVASTSGGTTTTAFNIDAFGNTSIGNSLYYDADTGLTNVAGLSTGNLNFEDDSGAVSWVDMNLTASSTVGTLSSYTANLGGQQVLTIAGWNDGLGGFANGPFVGIGTNAANPTSTPNAMLMVWGTSTDPIAHFLTTASATAFIVTSDGKVGIGATSTPPATLSVQGNLMVYTTGTSTIYGGLALPSVGEGTLTTDAAGNMIVSSDERLKEVKSGFTRGLAAVLALNPINYQWRPETGYDTKNIYTGFSAQNVQTVIPEAVGVNSAGYLTLSDRPILGAVVNAIKEQQLQIAILSGALSTSSLPEIFSTSTDAELGNDSARSPFGSATSQFLSVFDYFVSKVTAGINIVKDLSAARLTAIVGYFDHVETYELKVKRGIEMTDQATGSLYCVIIENGGLKNIPGRCADMATTTDVVTPEEAGAQGSTTTDPSLRGAVPGDEAISSASSTLATSTDPSLRGAVPGDEAISGSSSEIAASSTPRNDNTTPSSTPDITPFAPVPSDPVPAPAGIQDPPSSSAPAPASDPVTP